MYNKIFSIRNINAFLILFVSAVLTNCAGSSKLSEENLLVEMRKTPCYGFCPVYELKIDESGYGMFLGTDHVEPIGSYSFKLKANEIDSLISWFAEADFFNLENSYESNATDLPTTYLTYRKGGMEKKVIDYDAAPDQLRELEQKIETLVLSRKMKKIGESKE